MGTLATTNRWRAPVGRATAGAERRRRYLGSLGRSESCYWLLVFLASVADVGLTVHGRQSGLVELNPLARTMIETHGYAVMIPMKAAAVSVALAGWAVLSERQRWIVPASLALPWTAGAIVNLGLIATVG